MLKEIHLSKVYFTSKRLNVQWGGYSQIATELLLLREASVQQYDYYHFMSGIDMVIKSTDVFDSFFEDKNNEFISFCGEDWNEKVKERLKYWYIEAGRNKLKKMINKVSIKCQKLLKVNKLKKLNCTIVGGSNWCSITNEFVQYVFSKESWIKKVFKHSFCADELFLHMLAYHSEFKNKIYLLKIPTKNNDYDTDLYLANMRYIDWNRGKPYTFTNEDLDDLIQCPYLFARKFNLTDKNNVSLELLNALHKI